MMTTSPEQAASSLLPQAASPELVASIQHALALKDLLEQEFEALQDGRLNEQIRLRNPESGTTLSGIITGKGMARGL